MSCKVCTDAEFLKVLEYIDKDGYKNPVQCPVCKRDLRSSDSSYEDIKKFREILKKLQGL